MKIVFLILEEATRLGVLISEGKWAEVATLAAKLTKDIYDCIQCFRKGSEEQMVFGLMDATGMESISDCVLKHLKNAFIAFKLAIDDI